MSLFQAAVYSKHYREHQSNCSALSKHLLTSVFYEGFILMSFSILATTKLLTLTLLSIGGHSALLTISPLTSLSVSNWFVLLVSDVLFGKKYVNQKI